MGNSAIGVDIGGTLTKLVWFEESGKVIDEKRIASPAESAADLVDAIAAAIEPWMSPGDRPAPDGVGVAVPGLVLAAEGRVLRAPNLGILDDFPIGEELAAALGGKVVVDNDGHTAGLAEVRLGAAVGAEMAVCLTVGTGVGGAIIERGRVWRGCGGLAGEFGRMVLDAEGRTFFEEEVGATAVVQAYLDRGGAPAADIDAAEVSRRAAAGEEAAVAAFELCGRRLGIGLALLVNLLNPQFIVVGGGVAGAGELFLGPARAEAERRAWQQAWAQCDVVPALLGANAGAIGAALLTWD